MKKKKIYIVLILFIFLIKIANISNAGSIDLQSYINGIKGNNTYIDEEYYHDYDTGGKYGYGKYDFSNNTGINLSVNYRWLYKLNDLLKKINSSEISYNDIVESNTADEIKNTQNILKKYTVVTDTFAYAGKHVDKPSNINKWGDIINTQRSRAAFRNITGYNDTGKYNTYMHKALLEINAAYDKKTGKSNFKGQDQRVININDDYETKFKYTYEQVKGYYKYAYGYRYNLNKSQGEMIEKVFKIKIKLNDMLNGNSSEKEKYVQYRGVLTRTDLYVDINDSISKKKAYDKDQKFIYTQLYGSQGLSEDEKKDINVDEEIDKDISDEEVDKSIENMQEEFNNITDTSEYEKDNAARQEEEEKKDDKDKDTVFNQPVGSGAASNGVKDALSDADSFVQSGDQGIVSTENLQSFSQNLYSILLAIGVVIAVIMGTILGVKLMVAPIEERVEAKKLLVPYVVGCVIVFGAFGIWKLVVTIMQGL